MRRAVFAVAGTLAVAAATPARATVVFSSERCDQGGKVVGPIGLPGQPPPAPMCESRIWRVEDDGSGLRPLTDGGHYDASKGEYDSGGDRYPSWSPDGTQILFGRPVSLVNAGATVRFWLMNSDGSGQREVLREENLPDGYSVGAGPYWMPDGRSILFVGNRFGGATRALFSIRLDGSGLRQLTPTDQSADAPAISGDGLHIAYLRTTYPHGPPGPAEPTPDAAVELTLMNADGSGPVPLTMSDLQVVGNGMSMSPDGRYLALTIGDHLYTMNIGTGELVARTDHIGLEPAWAAFGQKLIYSAALNPDDQFSRLWPLWTVDLTSGDTTELTPANDVDGQPRWHPLGVAVPTPPQLPTDVIPPTAAVLPGVPVHSSARASASAAQARLRFLVADRSGIRRVDAAIGRRVGRKRCRFLVGGHLGRIRSCARPVYRTIPSAQAWDSRARHLRRGVYEVRFRTTDVRGNRTRRPKLHVVHVRA